MNELLQASFEIAQEAVRRGAQVLKSKWGRTGKIDRKSNSIDLVTEVDKASEEAILGYLKRKAPQMGILAEESGDQPHPNSSSLWVVDPLDGTTNYTHGYPMVSISVALIQNDQPVLGIVYNPLIEEYFYAIKGQGAYFNGHQVHVSSIDRLDNSLMASGFSYDRRTHPETNYREFCLLTHCTQGVRRGGSAALDLAYVSAGRLEGYWERGIKPWDIAAGILLVEEAGGKVTRYDQSPLHWRDEKILATNGFIHQTVSGLLLGSDKSFLANSSADVLT